MRRWRGATVKAAVALAAVATLAPVAAASQQAAPALHLAATVVYSDGGCGPVGLDAWVAATLPKRTSSGQERQLTRAYRPTSGTLSVDGHTYRLVYDPSVASGDPAKLIWGLHHIAVSRGVAKAMLGKTAVLQVGTSAHGARELRTRVILGRCGGLQ
jgi:hypothetical protein